MQQGPRSHPAAVPPRLVLAPRASRRRGTDVPPRWAAAATARPSMPFLHGFEHVPFISCHDDARFVGRSAHGGAGARLLWEARVRPPRGPALVRPRVRLCRAPPRGAGRAGGAPPARGRRRRDRRGTKPRAPGLVAARRTFFVFWHTMIEHTTTQTLTGGSVETGPDSRSSHREKRQA